MLKIIDFVPQMYEALSSELLNRYATFCDRMWQKNYLLVSPLSYHIYLSFVLWVLLIWAQFSLFLLDSVPNLFNTCNLPQWPLQCWKVRIDLVHCVKLRSVIYHSNRYTTVFLSKNKLLFILSIFIYCKILFINSFSF